jgi:ribose transport system substrate-binding protein
MPDTNMRPSGSRWAIIAAAAILAVAFSSTAALTQEPSGSPAASTVGATSAPVASEAAIPTASRAYNIAMVAGQATDPFFVTVAAGAKAEAAKLGVNLNWQAPQEFDPSLQIPILSSVLASHPDFLIVHPTDKNALVEPIRQFTDAGIPVITTGADPVDKTVRLGYIATDNIGGGTLEAQFLSDAIGATGGKVTLITCPPGVPCGDDRRIGFETEVANHPQLTYVGDQIYNGSDTTDAVRVMQAELQKDPDLAGVAASDGSAGLGAATAINEAGKSGQIKVVSFDAGPDLVAALKNGQVSALIIQQSYNIGKMAVDYAVQYLNGGFTVPDTTRIPPIIGTPENIDSPDIAKFLYAPAP